MELPGVDASRAKLAALLLALVLAASLVAVGVPGSARAATRTVTATTTTTVADPNTPVLVTSENTPPKGYRLTAAKVKRLAGAALAIKAELRRHPDAVAEPRRGSRRP